MLGREGSGIYHRKPELSCFGLESARDHSPDFEGPDYSSASGNTSGKASDSHYRMGVCIAGKAALFTILAFPSHFYLVHMFEFVIPFKA